MIPTYDIFSGEDGTPIMTKVTEERKERAVEQCARLGVVVVVVPVHRPVELMTNDGKRFEVAPL